MAEFETTHKVVGPKKGLQEVQLYFLLDWVIGEMTSEDLRKYAEIAEYPEAILELASEVKKGMNK